MKRGSGASKGGGVKRRLSQPVKRDVPQQTKRGSQPTLARLRILEKISGIVKTLTPNCNMAGVERKEKSGAEGKITKMENMVDGLQKVLDDQSTARQMPERGNCEKRDGAGGHSRRGPARGGGAPGGDEKRQLKTSTPGAEPLHLPCSLPSGRGRGQRAARADAHTIHRKRSHNTNIFCKWELLLLASPSNTLLECRSNQRIRPKTDSRVPKCGVPMTPSNRVRG